MVSIIMALISIFLIREWLGDGVGMFLFFGYIVFLIVLGVSASHKEDKAYWNRVEYWSKGGPDRKKEE